jgi:hypothetical protein
MQKSSRPLSLFVDLRPRRPVSRGPAAVMIAALIAASAGLPAAATAKPVRAGMAGGYDGSWSVLIVTQAGGCDPAYSFPVQIVGGRVQSNAATATITGSVGRGGGVSVRVSSGGSYALGSGRLSMTSGAGNWSGKGSTGVCSGRWQATRT